MFDQKGYYRFLQEMGLPDNEKSRMEYQQYMQTMQTGKAPTKPGLPGVDDIPELNGPGISDIPEQPGDNQISFKQGLGTQNLFNALQRGEFNQYGLISDPTARSSDQPAIGNRTRRVL